MPIKIEFLPISGESILITTNQSTVLIDGGRKKDFKILKNKLLDLKKPIDVMVLTHIDDDHIGGFNKIVNNLTEFDIKELWFNCTKEQDFLDNGDSYNINTSYKNGSNLFAKLSKTDVKHINYINTESYKDIFYLTDDVRIKILSPTEQVMNQLFSNWKSNLYKKENINTSSYYDYDKTFTELAATTLGKDESLPNCSSIAFIMFYKKYKFLFLGDAHANVIHQSLKSWASSDIDSCNFDLIKMSHHGSSKNINIELLNLWQSENYIFCCKGWDYMPHKKTLAYLMEVNQSKKINFVFNKKIENSGFNEKTDKASFLYCNERCIFEFE